MFFRMMYSLKYVDIETQKQTIRIVTEEKRGNQLIGGDIEMQTKAYEYE